MNILKTVFDRFLNAQTITIKAVHHLEKINTHIRDERKRLDYLTNRLSPSSSQKNLRDHRFTLQTTANVITDICKALFTPITGVSFFVAVITRDEKLKTLTMKLFPGYREENKDT